MAAAQHPDAVGGKPPSWRRASWCEATVDKAWRGRTRRGTPDFCAKKSQRSSPRAGASASRPLTPSLR